MNPNMLIKPCLLTPCCPALNVPCVNGKQQFVAYSYPGLIVKHPTGTENYNIRGKFKVAANFHIGNIGLAPNYESPVTSVPPTRTGGNIDNRRIGAGASLYLPVEVGAGGSVLGITSVCVVSRTVGFWHSGVEGCVMEHWSGVDLADMQTFHTLCRI